MSTVVPPGRLTGLTARDVLHPDEFGRLRQVSYDAHMVATSLRDPLPRHRPPWDVTWMNVAIEMANRAECTRSRVGACVVVENRGVWVGYNGAPAGETHCTDGGCPRGRSTLSATELGPGYSNCIALHSEMNAVVRAGERARGGTCYVTQEPCDWCVKILRTAGVVRVVWLTRGGMMQEAQLVLPRVTEPRSPGSTRAAARRTAQAGERRRSG